MPPTSRPAAWSFSREGSPKVMNEGRNSRARLSELARRRRLALLGPNCQGLLNTIRPCAAYSAPLNVRLPAGRVAFLSQSGGLATAMLNNSVGVSFSHVVSVGNEAVVDTAALVNHLVDDDTTDVILAFLETIRAPGRFFAACERALAAGKPVVVLKSGRTSRVGKRRRHTAVRWRTPNG